MATDYCIFQWHARYFMGCKMVPTKGGLFQRFSVCDHSLPDYHYTQTCSLKYVYTIHRIRRIRCIRAVETKLLYGSTFVRCALISICRKSILYAMEWLACGMWIYAVAVTIAINAFAIAPKMFRSIKSIALHSITWGSILDFFVIFFSSSDARDQTLSNIELFVDSRHWND